MEPKGSSQNPLPVSILPLYQYG